MKCCKCEVDKRSNEMALDLKLSCKHSHFSLCYKCLNSQPRCYFCSEGFPEDIIEYITTRYHQLCYYENKVAVSNAQSALGFIIYRIPFIAGLDAYCYCYFPQNSFLTRDSFSTEENMEEGKRYKEIHVGLAEKFVESASHLFFVVTGTLTSFKDVSVTDVIARQPLFIFNENWLSNLGQKENPFITPAIILGRLVKINNVWTPESIGKACYISNIDSTIRSLL